MEIKGKVALVTGGGSGIGRATALRLAREGASVVVADIDEEGGRETVRQIEALPGKGRAAFVRADPSLRSGQAPRAAFIRADVTLEADVRAMMAFTEDTFGGLDILHNNAGILTGRPRFPDAEPGRWGRVLETNLGGVVLGTHYGVQALRNRGGGVIVNTASMAGLAGFAADPVYAATKGGVVMFTHSLAHLQEELSIRVNCVCPGIVDTPMLTRGREEVPAEEQERWTELMRQIPLIPAEEVADAVVELIRDDSLAGRAMTIRNGMPRALAELPDLGRLAREL